RTTSVSSVFIGGFKQRSLRAADPCRESLPLRIVLRRPVLAAGMEGDTTRLGRQRHREQPARERVPGHHEPQGCFEIAARFLFVPGRAPGCERLQTEGCSLRMTHEAPRPTLALVQEDGLDARPEKFEIERRNSSGGRGSLLCGRNIQRTD